MRMSHMVQVLRATALYRRALGGPRWFDNCGEHLLLFVLSALSRCLWMLRCCRVDVVAADDPLRLWQVAPDPQMLTVLLQLMKKGKKKSGGKKKKKK
jgi:hypothetical protein